MVGLEKKEGQSAAVANQSQRCQLPNVACAGQWERTDWAVDTDVPKQQQQQTHKQTNGNKIKTTTTMT